jgi:hypothetical protein
MVLLNGFLEEFEAPSKGKHGQNFRVCMLSSRICPPQAAGHFHFMKVMNLYPAPLFWPCLPRQGLLCLDSL